MKFRKMPRTDMVLSEVGFGVWTVATNWWGKIEDADKAALLENAVEEGINFFDTADTYGDGYGEEILATASGPPSTAVPRLPAGRPGWDGPFPVPPDRLTPKPHPC